MIPTSITLLELSISTVAPLTEMLNVLLPSGKSGVNDVLLDAIFEGRPTLEELLDSVTVLEDTVSVKGKLVLLPPYIGASMAVGLMSRVTVTYDVFTPGSGAGVFV